MTSVTSPSGKYRLDISCGESWSSQGKVFRAGQDTPIAEVQRNYSSFPHLFVEGHPEGDFLICGSDYQGQTVIDLGSGQRKDFLPEEAEQGHGFCWAEYQFEPRTGMLTVLGCHWACPYEYRFYDFSHPMDWVVLPTFTEEGETCVGADGKWPEHGEDGLIRCFQQESESDNDSEVDAISTFKRDGSKLILTESWVSDKEQERRIAAEEANRKYRQRMKDFRSSDPLYLAYLKELANPGPLSPEDYEGIGVTYEGWCKTFKGNESRMCRRIATRKEGLGITIDLEWAMTSGPIKLALFAKDGRSSTELVFEHSVKGMVEAFEHAKNLLQVVS